MRTLNALSRHAVLLFFATVFLATSGFGAAYFNLKDQLPQIPENLRYLNQQPPTEIYSHDGKLLKVLGDRSYMTLDLISPHFQKAIVAATAGQQPAGLQLRVYQGCWQLGR